MHNKLTVTGTTNVMEPSYNICISNQLTQVLPIIADVTDDQQLKSLAEGAVKHFGKVNILVCIHIHLDLF